MCCKLKPYSRKSPYSYTLGVAPTLELIAHRPLSARKVILSTRSADNRGAAKLRRLCAELRIEVQTSDRALRRISKAGNCYAAGIFAKYHQRLSPQASHVVLVNPDDLGNIGTIVRTMLGYGMRDLAIIEPATDLFHPRAVRASMGALFRLRFAYFPDFSSYRARHPRSIYAFMTDGRRGLAETAFPEPCALVFGNEGWGLPPEYAQLGASVRIEQCETIDSLNLAVAAGIALHRVYTSRRDIAISSEVG
jgi:TrmH family RNA methyltransferase